MVLQLQERSHDMVIEAEPEVPEETSKATPLPVRGYVDGGEPAYTEAEAVTETEADAETEQSPLSVGTLSCCAAGL